MHLMMGRSSLHSMLTIVRDEPRGMKVRVIRRTSSSPTRQLASLRYQSLILNNFKHDERSLTAALWQQLNRLISRTASHAIEAASTDCDGFAGCEFRQEERRTRGIAEGAKSIEVLHAANFWRTVASLPMLRNTRGRMRAVWPIIYIA